MNLKKILILPVGFMFTNIMYIACCNCKPVTKYYQVVNVSVKPSGSKNAVVDNGAPVFVDSLYLDYFFNNECVASNQNNFSFLVNTASACSCVSCGEENGLKSKLISIEISSDNIYNGSAANSSLNNLFKTYNKYNLQNGFDISIDSVVNLINNNQMRLADVNIYTKTKPGNALGHQLNLKATFASGSTFSSKTKAIYWQ